MRFIFTLCKRLILLVFILISSLQSSFAQNNDSIRFESQYKATVQFLNIVHDSLELSVDLMKENDRLTDVQKARLDFLRVGLYSLYELDPLFYRECNLLPVSDDSIPMFSQAQIFIKQSNKNLGIPLILKYIETVDPNSDSAVLAKIFLAEGYRKLSDFQKGIDVINELLEDENISLKNRAFACNRIAAIYDECGNSLVENRYDSVEKYSKICIKISSENNFIEHLATSQNELAYNYKCQNKLQSSIDYGSKAVKNFISIGENASAMQASTNLAMSFFKLNKPDEAIEILNSSLELGDINENKSLFIRTYLVLSDVYKSIGDFQSAYEYLKMVRSMQNQNNRKKVKKQIYEMAAKYDLQAKENKIKEEQHKSKIYQQQRKYFIIIIIISLLLLFILLFLFRFKHKAYKTLLQQNLISRRAEKELEKKIREYEFPEPTIEKQHSEEEKYNQLGMKFEKFMIEEKPYLFENLNMDEVSRKLNTNRTYLSKAIQVYFNESFNNLVCAYRIRTARDFLLDPDNNHISVEGIGKMAGFKSNSTFHKNFKFLTGLTPNYFRNNSKSE